MRHRKRAHRILVVNGDQAHCKQGFDVLLVTPVRIVHPEGDCALVWEESVREHSGYVMKWMGTSSLLPCVESERSGEHEEHAVMTYEVGLSELLPIRASG
jgi:hypothetical protein